VYVCGTYTLPHPHIDAKRGTLTHTVAPGQAGFVLVSYPYLSYLCASHLAGNHGSLPARRAKTKTRKSGNNAAGVAEHQCRSGSHRRDTWQRPYVLYGCADVDVGRLKKLIWSSFVAFLPKLNLV